MSETTLRKIHEDILGLKRDIEHIKSVIDEEYIVADDVVSDIKNSRERPQKSFISHEEIKREFV